jgi:hypothetical protein
MRFFQATFFLVLAIFTPIFAADKQKQSSFTVSVTVLAHPTPTITTKIVNGVTIITITY